MSRTLMIVLLAVAQTSAGEAAAQEEPSAGPVDLNLDKALINDLDGLPHIEHETPLWLLLRQFTDEDIAVRTQTVREFRDYMATYPPTDAHKHALLMAASLDFQDVDLSMTDISSELVIAAGELAPSHISTLWDHFDGYSPRARTRVLDQLARMDSPLATATWLDLAMAYKNSLDSLPTGTIGSEPRMGSDLWPELLLLLDQEPLRHDVATLCLQHVIAGEIVKARPAVALRMIELAAELRTGLMPQQQATGIGWRYAEDYQVDRDTASLALDVLGQLGGNASLDELRASLAYTDPRLQYFAVTGLLHQGEEVDDDAIAAVAADPEMRTWLFEALSEHDAVKRIPRKHRSPEALAEGIMVGWLAFPTELGRAPDDIELMEVVRDGKGADALEFYLFRFRTHEPHWAADKGWLAGVAGPFRRGDQPTTEALGGTFSSFTPWEEQTPDQHVAAIRALLADWQVNAPEE